MNHSSDKRPFGALSFEGTRRRRRYRYLLLPRGHGYVVSSGKSGGTAPAGYAQVEGVEARAAMTDFLRSLTNPWGGPEHGAALHELRRLVQGSPGFRTDAWNRSTGRPWQKAVGDVLEARFVLLRKEVAYQDAPIAPEVEEPRPAEPAPTDSTEKTWIEVRVEDEDGNPIRNTRYELKTPDGEVHRGKTDHDGGIYYNNLTASGSCELTLPRLEKPSASG